MHNVSTWIKRLVFIFLLVFPSIAWANRLSIIDVETPQTQTPSQAAELSVYFDYESNSKMPITGLTADNCQININGKTPDVVHSEVVPFVEGDLGVGVLFVFPNSKNYSEDSFGIRSTLKNLLQKMNRPIDQLNLITYERHSTSQGWSVASEKTLINQLDKISTTDEIEPNLFVSFAPTISAFDSLKGVSQKYLVIISDAEGALFNDYERSATLIAQFIDQLKKNDIIPIIVAYSPDGRDAMPNINQISRIATQLDGYYYVAESESAFQQIMLSNIYDVIFSKYLLKATLDMSGENALPMGSNYPLELVVKTMHTDAQGDHAKTKIDWPELSVPDVQSVLELPSSEINPWGILKDLIVFVLGLLAGAGIMRARRNS